MNKIKLTEKYVIIENDFLINIILEYINKAIDGDMKWVYSTNYDATYRPFYRTKDCAYLPAQYLDFILILLNRYKLQVEVITDYEDYELEPQLPKFPFELYSYQKEIINTILKSNYKGTNIYRRFGIIDFDTNAGKTEVIAAIANTFEYYNRDAPNNKTIIVSYDGQGAEQTQDRLFEYGMITTRVLDIPDRKEAVWKTVNSHKLLEEETISLRNEIDCLSIANVIIMTIDQFKTFGRRLEERKWLTCFTLEALLWDEPDKITQKTVEAFISIQKNLDYFNYVWGFTGTYGLNSTVRKLMVSQVVGTPYKLKVKYSELKEQGQSSNVIVRRLLVPNFSPINTYLIRMYEYIDNKNWVYKSFENYKAVPEKTKEKYKKDVWQVLRGLQSITNNVRRKLFLNYWKYLSEIDAYNLEADILAYDEKLISTILNPILDEYVKAYRENNSIGLLINSINQIAAIDLTTKIIDNYIKRNRVKGCVVVAGHNDNGNLNELKSKFQKQEINIFVTASVKHGLNHRNLFGVVSYTGKGTDKLRQFLGRAERMNDYGKVFVFDINLEKYAFKTLKKHELSRLELYKQIGYDIINK